nr:MAG TPA_asm: hypothetical protein [Caudoviricetes sp.]
MRINNSAKRGTAPHSSANIFERKHYGGQENVH